MLSSRPFCGRFSTVTSKPSARSGDRKQAKRATAREVAADQTPKALEKALKKVAAKKRRKRVKWT
jgi:hypothetical protein